MVFIVAQKSLILTGMATNYQPCVLKEADVVGGLGIHSFLKASNTDYEFRDFRIWEIDDLGGGNS